MLQTRPDSSASIRLPSTYRSGAYLFVNPRFCLQLPSGTHCCATLAFDYPSPPSGWIWTLIGIYAIMPTITN